MLNVAGWKICQAQNIEQINWQKNMIEMFNSFVCTMGTKHQLKRRKRFKANDKQKKNIQSQAYSFFFGWFKIRWRQASVAKKKDLPDRCFFFFGAMLTCEIINLVLPVCTCQVLKPFCYMRNDQHPFTYTHTLILNTILFQMCVLFLLVMSFSWKNFTIIFHQSNTSKCWIPD